MLLRREPGIIRGKESKATVREWDSAPSRPSQAGQGSVSDIRRAQRMPSLAAAISLWNKYRNRAAARIVVTAVKNTTMAYTWTAGQCAITVPPSTTSKAPLAARHQAKPTCKALPGGHSGVRPTTTLETMAHSFPQTEEMERV